MNCPSCKNPVQANDKECEWCGADVLILASNQLFNIVLVDGGRNKLAVVKEIKDLTGFGLYECKQIIDTKNSIILSTKEIKIANYIKEKFNELGAVVRID